MTCCSHEDKTLHKTPTPMKGWARQLSTNENCWQAKRICPAKMYWYCEVNVPTLFKNYALFPLTTFNNNSYSKTNKMHLFLKLFILVKHSTCFGRSLRPSSGAQDCTYSNRRMSNSCCYLLLAGMRWACSSIPSPLAAAVWHMPVAVRAVLRSWWWTERPSETCRVFYKNK